MGFENQNKGTNEKSTVVTGLEGGTPVYEEKVIEKASQPIGVEGKKAVDAFVTQAINDFASLPETNKPMKLGRHQDVLLSINSGTKHHYKVIDGKKGYYLLGKHDTDSDPTLGSSAGAFVSMRGPRNIENPDMIMCSESELENWLA